MVELLVVIAIIGVLVALLLPAVQAAREAARRTQCANQIRQVALACLTYHDAKNELPPAGDAVGAAGTKSATGMSYLALVLPFMEGQNLRNLIDVNQHWSHVNNDRAEATVVPTFNCPSAGPDLEVFYDNAGSQAAVAISQLRAHYVGVMGAKTVCPVPNNTAPPANGHTMLICGTAGEAGGLANNGAIVVDGDVDLRRVSDGTSNTFLVAEQSWNAGPTRTWIVGILDANAYDPVGQTGQSWIYNSENVAYPMHTARRASEGQAYSGYPNNDTSIGSRHISGAYIALVDGSARFFREDVDLNGVLKAMSTRANDEVVTGEN